MTNENTTKEYLFTHKDLDGAACAVLFNLYQSKNMCIILCDYNDIDEKIEYLLMSIDKKENYNIFISDICPYKETCLKLDEINNEENVTVKLFDHHKTKSWVLQYSWATFDTKTSGTGLVYKYLTKNIKTKEVINNFVSAVTAWDIWQTKSKYRKKGKNLNAICKFIGLKMFIETFTKDITADIKELKILIKFLDIRKDEYVNKIIGTQLNKARVYTDGYMNMFKIIFATDYLSEIGHTILNHEDGAELKYVCLVNPITNTVSMRSRTDGVDVGKIAKEFRGGGHYCASGFRINFMNNIEKRIADKLNKLDYY